MNLSGRPITALECIAGILKLLFKGRRRWLGYGFRSGDRVSTRFGLGHLGSWRSICQRGLLRRQSRVRLVGAYAKALFILQAAEAGSVPVGVLAAQP